VVWCWYRYAPPVINTGWSSLAINAGWVRWNYHSLTINRGNYKLYKNCSDTLKGIVTVDTLTSYLSTIVVGPNTTRSMFFAKTCHRCLEQFTIWFSRLLDFEIIYTVDLVIALALSSAVLLLLVSCVYFLIWWCFFDFILGLFSELDLCYGTLTLIVFRAVFSILSVSLPCPTACSVTF